MIDIATTLWCCITFLWKKAPFEKGAFRDCEDRKTVILFGLKINHHLRQFHPSPHVFSFLDDIHCLLYFRDHPHQSTQQ
jgi:hypothetical protein